VGSIPPRPCAPGGHPAGRDPHRPFACPPLAVARPRGAPRPAAPRARRPGGL